MDRRSFVTGLVVGGAVGAGAATILNKPKAEAVKTVAAPMINKDRIEIDGINMATRFPRTWNRRTAGSTTSLRRF